MSYENLEGLSVEELGKLHYGSPDMYADNNPNEPTVVNNDEPEYNDENTDPSNESHEDPQNPQDLEPTGEEELEEDPTNVDEEETLEDSTIDWSAIAKPFKANGTMMTVETAEEAIRLMQQGIGAQKVIKEYNEHRPFIKALTDNGLMNEDTINLLIEAKKGNLGAYKGLLNSLGFDNEQFDDLQYSEELNEFKPQNHLESPELFNFRDALQRFDEDYPEESVEIKTLVGGFQDGSVDVVYQNPQVLSAIANVRANGKLDEIKSLTEKAYALGYVDAKVPRINTMSHLISKMSEELGVDLTQRNAKPIQNNRNEKVVTKKTKTVKRRSASRSPQSAVPSESHTDLSPAQDIERRLAEARDSGDIELMKKILNDNLDLGL